MSAKSISIVTVSIFGSVFLGIFLSTLIFIEGGSPNSEGAFESDSSKTPIDPSLPTLYFLTVEFNLKKTLELGTQDGASTLVLTEAASKINGYVWSIDVDECFEAKMKISQAGLEKYWTFIQGDDIEIGKNWKESVDHIFIDTSHAYQHTIDEIKLFEPFLKPQGFLTFHDTRSFPGVIKAIRDYLKSIDKKFSFYNYFNNNGFVILRKTG